MKRYRISEKAISDLEEIWLYTYNKWSKAQADKYYRLIINEIEAIANNYDFCKNIDYIKPGYRMSKVKSHLIFFRTASNKVIEIIRILHQSMDIENRLLDDV